MNWIVVVDCVKHNFQLFQDVNKNWKEAEKRKSFLFSKPSTKKVHTSSYNRVNSWPILFDQPHHWSVFVPGCVVSRQGNLGKGRDQRGNHLEFSSDLIWNMSATDLIHGLFCFLPFLSFLFLFFFLTLTYH